MTATRTAIPWSRTLIRLLALVAVVFGLQVAPAHHARAATPFKVLAFYDGTYDAAHISFVHEANAWFPQHAAQYGFSYTSTNDWTQLNAANLANYQVVMFLDNAPQTAAEQSAFQTYMNNGGGWIGFHVAAYNDSSSNSWSWYHQTFLGTGLFESNSWGPTSETLKIEDPGHPATAGLPSTITSSVSEWYSWQNDLRQNPNIDILASMDQSTFPIGTDPDQTWYSGYYPIVWTNRNYKMVYNNFGHNAMDYATNTTLSSTFASAQQNQLLIQEIRWAAGQSGPVTPPPANPVGAIQGYGGKCVDVAGASSTNGAAVQLYDCNGTNAQSWTVGSDGTLKALGKCMDVTAAGTANGTKVDLYDCNGTGSQVWQKSGSTLVNPQSGKCLDATGPSSANGTRLQIWTCGTGANQQWTLPS
ncbi:Ricin-type beta-trefoil lectin domain-containing protein [Streptomyces sp. DvalAA-14]|uniref:ThuA domain-containing protein n=1 Tax=unclassified Streptomyces TaxID=2593676 RepID=UPI00081AF638|nr:MULTISPECIES: ThuA domain-containing protein [unclassified Streptomyces]MYS23480.1 1,4-beta-xylanase [Streptomyces sp. SID4948]SCE33874.1 Ricin-type beta-trefoil lectin domain-containing protein [Streptomyces sp. DvalAA-14]